MPLNPNPDQFALVNVVASVILQRDGKILLVQEGKPEVYGIWNLPGGRVEKGESIETAAIREAREETGYVIELDEALPVYHASSTLPVIHHFVAHITGGSLDVTDDEILAAQWFEVNEIRTMKKTLRHPDNLLSSLDALGL